VAVRGGGLFFLSGQVAQNRATGELIDGDVAQEADQILRNIAATPAMIDKDLDDVIRVGSTCPMEVAPVVLGEGAFPRGMLRRSWLVVRIVVRFGGRTVVDRSR